MTSLSHWLNFRCSSDCSCYFPAIFAAQIDSLINHSLHCIPFGGSESNSTVLCCVYKMTKENHVNTINYLSTKIIKSLSLLCPYPCDYSMEIKLKIRKIERINNNQLIQISIVINKIVLLLLATRFSLPIWFNAMLKIKTNNYTHWRTIRMRINPFAFWCDQLLAPCCLLLYCFCCCSWYYNGAAEYIISIHIRRTGQQSVMSHIVRGNNINWQHMSAFMFDQL